MPLGNREGGQAMKRSQDISPDGVPLPGGIYMFREWYVSD